MTTSGFYNWSTTSNTNATADGTINWQEGQAPSSINDSARSMMSRLREWGNDIAGTITAGGTSTAFTVSSGQVFDSLAHLAGQVIGFVPSATNANTVGNDVTLNVDSLGAKPIRMQPSIPLPSGALILGTPYVVVYNNVDSVFYLQGWTNPYVIPLGAGMDYWGSSTPNSSFAFPTGQAISRTTYASLFSLVGTTYGTGDGSTTFNLPDKTGRISAMKEASATRLHNAAAGFNADSTALGAAGGQDRTALSSTNQIPQFTPAGTITNGAITQFTINVGSTAGGGGSLTTGGFSASANFTPGGNGLAVTQAASTFSGNAVGSGSPSQFATCQPTIICNYIIRVI